MLKYIKLVDGGKRPAEKDSHYTSLEKLDTAGLKITNKVVVVDIDGHNQEEREQHEKIINQLLTLTPTFNVETSRGKHLYYKRPTGLMIKNWTKNNCVGGFQVDYKTGTYVKIKDNGKLRTMSDSLDNLDLNNLPELPALLYPMLKNNKTNMLCLSDGDGRNDEIFKHLCCVKETYPIDITSVSNFINTYVFKDKLQDKELQNIVESIYNKQLETKPAFFGGKEGTTLLPQKFAEYLIKEDYVCKINDQLHIYKDGVYVSGADYIENAMLRHIPDIKSSNRTEVLKMLKILNLENQPQADPQYIAFNNGIYHLGANQLLGYDPSIIITNKIPHNYNENATSEFLDNILNDWATDTNGNYSKDIRLLIEEMIGLTFYRSNDISTAFMLTGGKDNGKSKFYYLLQEVLGDHNYSSVKLQDLNTRFKNFDVYGKLANIGDDINNDTVKATDVFKNLVTGEKIQLEKKGQDPITYTSTCKLYFSANDRPRIIDDTGAVIDKRFLFVPFRNYFDKANKKTDPHLKSKLKNAEVLEYAIKVGVDGIKRVLKNRAFTTCDIIEKEKELYKYETNPILQFVDEYGIENIENQLVDVVYQAFEEFLKGSGEYFKPDKRRLGMSLNKEFGIKSITRATKIMGVWKRPRVYVKEDKNNG